MNILITGGAGFIGSHLCRRLIERGDKVICVDNFITGSRCNVQALAGNRRFRLLKHDVAKPLSVPGKLDWVLHFASIASPKHYLAYPIKTLESGLMGTYNCLELARRKSARFFFSSTSEVYGDPAVHPQVEEYWGNVNSIGVRSCYDESKRGGEAITYAFMRQHKVDVRLIRIFNTYGPNMQPDDGRVVSNFIVSALKGRFLTMYGDGRQTRSFCYVDDLVEGILKVMESGYQLPINLGNPNEFTIAQLADIVRELAGHKLPIKRLPLPQDDPKQRCPDITKARKLLGWEPRVALREGLTRTIEYFRQNI